MKNCKIHLTEQERRNAGLSERLDYLEQVNSQKNGFDPIKSSSDTGGESNFVQTNCSFFQPPPVNVCPHNEYCAKTIKKYFMKCGFPNDCKIKKFYDRHGDISKLFIGSKI